MSDKKDKKGKLIVVKIEVTQALLEASPELQQSGLQEGDEVALVGGRPDDRH